MISTARGLFLLLSRETGTERCAEFLTNPLISPGILPEFGKQSHGNTIHQWSFRKLPFWLLCFRCLPSDQTLWFGVSLPSQGHPTAQQKGRGHTRKQQKPNWQRGI